MSTKPADNRAADGNSPLLNGGASSALHDTIGNAYPGIDNSNIAVRSIAYSWHTSKVTLLSNSVNVLLVMVPLGIIAGKLGWSPTAIFTINFFAIIPLAAVLSFATEEISMKLGETLGGLLNATFGNAVELIVSIVALQRNEIELVQALMLGSILPNLLLVMGMCFLFGGIIHRGESGNGREQVFSSASAQTTCSLMTFSSASLVIPAALYAVLNQSGSDEKAQSILTLSRGTCCLITQGC
ncbi:Vacuolar calcium ion transporter [Fusarium oxysporum f. sp. cubense]|uniref:Vacuolar calcium ion transporter n=1 Tax=Fusarium oxysporum f. sp. cubense TaxID=61366 RepID=A0A559LK85_FUSOC|nr:Vacuolar calcium ion transporter [Fusarium oxysporum f. sp. cubense]